MYISQVARLLGVVIGCYVAKAFRSVHPTFTKVISTNPYGLTTPCKILRFSTDRRTTRYTLQTLSQISLIQPYCRYLIRKISYRALKIAGDILVEFTLLNDSARTVLNQHA